MASPDRLGTARSASCFDCLLQRCESAGGSRRREIAIRTSLGAGQVAIVRQQLGESVLLAALGGALGIALARWSLDALVAFAPADLLRVSDLSVDLRVLLYTLGLSMLTGLIVGIVPALLVTRQSILSSIRASGLTITHLMTRIPRQASSSTKRSRQPTCPTSIRYTRR